MATAELAQRVGVKPACGALGVPRATLYRRRKPLTGRQQPWPTPARALSRPERQAVLDVLDSPRFVDRAPAEVVATLLDEDHYLCSERTMYRILAARAPLRERRNQLRHPAYAKPELVATAPNQVWSWDVTKLLGPEKWTYYYLYVLLDIFSRYVVGWMLAARESANLAGRLIEETCAKHDVQPQVLTLHSDRGSPMTAKCTAQLLADLGVTQSLSRPRVCDDNPFSEAQFKSPWYNTEHRHGGIALLTPHDVHYGRAAAGFSRRQRALDAAFEAHPERFPNGRPLPCSSQGRLHQPGASDDPTRRGTSLIPVPTCLKPLDRFRPAQSVGVQGRGVNE